MEGSVGAVVTELQICLRKLREEADRAEVARLEGSARVVEAAHAAGRALLDRISVALLAGGTEGDRQAGLFVALGASCAAEYARLEGRSDPSLWRTAADHWQHVALQGASPSAAPVHLVSVPKPV